MRVSCLSFLTHSVSEHPMSDHVPTVPAPAVLPDGGGSVRVTRAKALRSSMSSSVPGGAALVAPQHVQPDDPPQGDDSGVSSTFNITKPKVPDTVTGVPDANALLSGSGPPGGGASEFTALHVCSGPLIVYESELEVEILFIPVTAVTRLHS